MGLAGVRPFDGRAGFHDDLHSVTLQIPILNTALTLVSWQTLGPQVSVTAFEPTAPRSFTVTQDEDDELYSDELRTATGCQTVRFLHHSGFSS